MNEPFGTIKKGYCPGCVRIVQDEEGGDAGTSLPNLILGGDDDWYCEKCDSSHFKAIQQHYTKVVDQEFVPKPRT